ncbi:MAG: endonuclease/exonuclease/phosphatase family protein, partial [Natronosporangium sp.]
AYAAAGLAAGLGYVLPVMVYQVHYELQFPFDNRLVLVGFAVLLGLAGLGARLPSREPDRRSLAAWPAPVSVLAALLLLVPLALVVTRPAVPAPDQAGGTIRLMSWNLMYGRDPVRGDVDLAAVAAVVEQVDPDVLVLQEVARGWPIGGGVDMAEWLSRRLQMRYAWAPAANRQFGNALFTRLPHSDVEVERLPFGQGPMERSYLSTTLRLADGQQLRLVNTHLQHRKENSPTRLAQTDALLAAWDGAPGTVIAGDFNFWPSWQEADRWKAAGFVSAQDVTGHGAEFTVPSYDPDNRVDWIFGTPDLRFSDFAILSQVTASDHFPLVVTVQVG